MLLATEPTLPHLDAALRALPDFGACDVSAATVIEVDGHPILCAVSDEGRVIAFVPLDEHAQPDPVGFDLGSVLDGLGDKEIDLEGVTAVDGCVLAIGSLSLKRRKVRPEHDADEALRRLEKVTTASGGKRTHSDFAYRLRPRVERGRIVVDFVDRTEVRSALADLPLLAPFAAIPSKDNGLDVEGLALHGEHLYLGLRGPVVRGQALLARLSTDLGHPELIPVDLDGWGIRAVTSAGPRGLFVVSGPTLTHAGPFELWQVSVDASRPAVSRIGRLALAGRHKVETVFAWRGQLRVLLDGVHGGDPRTVRIVEPFRGA